LAGSAAKYPHERVRRKGAKENGCGDSEVVRQERRYRIRQRYGNCDPEGSPVNVGRRKVEAALPSYKIVCYPHVSPGRAGYCHERHLKVREQLMLGDLIADGIKAYEKHKGCNSQKDKSRDQEMLSPVPRIEVANELLAAGSLGFVRRVVSSIIEGDGIVGK
jgi:hypothetical protein